MLEEDYVPWSLKAEISYFIVPRLRCNIRKVRGRELVAIPDWIDSKNEILTNEQLVEKWAEILEDILVPFLYNVEPNLFEERSTMELEKMKSKGLRLFAEYFNHLWD